MKLADGLKAVVKIGLKVFSPVFGEIGAVIAEEGIGLLVDEAAKRRAADVHGRVLRSLESSFARFSSSEGLSDQEAESTIELTRIVLEKHGLQSGEWTGARFDANKAAAIVMGRANTIFVATGDAEKSRVETVTRAYYEAVLKDGEMLTLLEAEFRSSVLASIDQLARVVSAEQDSLRRERSTALIAASLVQVPTQHWRDGISPPGALLRADTEGGVPFHGRESELLDLEQWRDAQDPIRIRLYVGPGGIGKTRFMIECCRRAQRASWQAGFVSNRSKGVPAAVWDAMTRARRDNLLVLDYAETRASEISELARAAYALNAGFRTRIVLVARHAGDWWRELRNTAGPLADLLFGRATEEPIRLRPVASDVVERQAAYTLAQRTFAERLRMPIKLELAEDLSSNYFDRILLLHILALAAVEGVKTAGDRGLLDYVLARERRFWADMATSRQLPPYLIPAIAKAMAVVTLTGGVRTEKDALELIQQLPLLAGQSQAILSAIASILHDTYVGERWIEPVLPDLLGEHLVQAELDDSLTAIVFGRQGAQRGGDGG